MPSDVDELDELDRLIRRALEQKAAGFPSAAEDPRAGIRRARRRLLRNGAAAALAVALAAYGSVIAIDRLQTATPRPASTPTPIEGQLLAALAVPGAMGLTFEGGSAWVSVSGQPDSGRTEKGSPPPDIPSDSSPSRGAIVRIDPATREVLATIELPSDTVDIASGFGAVWAADRVRPSIYRVDPETNEVTSVALPAPVQHLMATDGSLWATSGESQSVFRIDPARARVVATIPVEEPALQELVALGSRIFANVDLGRMLEIDPSTDKVVGQIEGKHVLGSTSFAAKDAIWQAACIPDNPGEDPSNPGPCAWEVIRLDPDSGNATASVSVGQWFPEAHLPESGLATQTVSMEIGDAGLWVLTYDMVTRSGQSPDRKGRLLLIDPSAARVVATAAFEMSPSAGLYIFRVGEREVWVAPNFGDVVQP